MMKELNVTAENKGTHMTNPRHEAERVSDERLKYYMDVDWTDLPEQSMARELIERREAEKAGPVAWSYVEIVNCGQGQFIRSNHLSRSEPPKWPRVHAGKEYDAITDVTPLFAHAAPKVPDGMALVPRVITDDMAVAFAEQWYSKRRCIDDCDMQDAYAAMLAAAESGAK